MNYSALNGDDCIKNDIIMRQEAIREFIESVIKAEMRLFCELIKGGVPIVEFKEDKSLHLLKIRAGDYCTSCHDITIEVAVEGDCFDEIVIDRLKPLMEGLMHK